MPAEAGSPQDQTAVSGTLRGSQAPRDGAPAGNPPAPHAIDSNSTPGPTSPSTPAPTATSPSTRKRQPRAARGKADPNHPPFTGYLERDALRQSREKGRRRTLYISIALHVVVFASLLVYSLFQVEELWSPSVEVKVFSPSKLPPGVKDPKPVPPPPPTP